MELETIGGSIDIVETKFVGNTVVLVLVLLLLLV